jgi:phage terminase small subunit
MPILKNQRHEKAVQAFLSNGGNKSAAYRIGYPSSLKWKENVVAKRASELFQRGDIMGRVSELRDNLDEENKYSLDKVLEGFGQIAFYNIIDIFDFVEEEVISVEGEPDRTIPARLMLTGGAKKLSELPREITACISSLKQTKDGVEVKMYCRDNALAQIAKMKGYYAPEKVITAESTLADLLKKD